MTNPYFEIVQSAECEHEVKKSVFITRAHAITSREDAMSYIQKTREDYPDARHHCWAYLLGSPFAPENAAMSDDGEPSGTAGKPIYNVLQHKHVGNIVVIVIRYFGGIKLGAGGLVRAYSQAATQIYDVLSVTPHIAKSAFTARCSFEHEQQLRHWLNHYECSIISCDYKEVITMAVIIPDQHISTIFGQLAPLQSVEFKSRP